MKYLLVSPFDSGLNGVNSYIQNITTFLPSWLEPETFYNHKNDPIDVFRHKAAEYIQERYGRDEVMIEVPETRSAGLLIPPHYRVHTRLHTPLAICNFAEKITTPQSRFSDELRAITQCSVASSPSRGLLDALGPYVDQSRIAVFKNGISKVIEPRRPAEKTIDLLYMGRFQTLKGTQYLNALLMQLPANFRVVLVGSGATRFQLRPGIKASVHTFEHINGDQRFAMIADARVVLVPSLFENCSMVILEALRAGSPVVAWAVGGNGEFAADLVRTVPLDDIPTLVSTVLDTHARHPDPARFDTEVANINRECADGIAATVSRLADPSVPLYRSARVTAPPATHAPPIRYESPEALFSGAKVLGFSISNEHIEEMWAPVMHYLGVDYRFVCKRPLGFHSKFGRRYHVDPQKFTQYDWVKEPERLFKAIEAFRPDFLLTHNGAHPVYQAVLASLRAKFPIPIVHTELGWFPQQGNIYFDRLGTNAASSLAKRALGAGPTVGRATVKRDVLVPLQLNSDTQTKVNSRRFRTGSAFLKYVIDQVPAGHTIHVKPHPLDPLFSDYQAFASDRVVIHERDSDLSALFSIVGHVVGINSTVLLEALDHRVNVYSCGDGILQNKSVAIDFRHDELADVFTNKLTGSRAERDALRAFLLSRQIEVASLEQHTLAELSVLPDSLAPLAEALLMSNRPAAPVKGPAQKQVASGAGYAAFHAGRYDEAAKAMTAELSANPGDFSMLRSLAESYIRLGKDNEAKRALKQAIQVNPKHRRVKYRLWVVRYPWLSSVLRKTEHTVPKK